MLTLTTDMTPCELVDSHVVGDAKTVTISFHAVCDVFDSIDKDFIEQILEKISLTDICEKIIKCDGLRDTNISSSLRSLMSGSVVTHQTISNKLIEDIESTSITVNFIDIGSNIFSGEVRIVEHISIQDARKIEPDLINKFSIRVKTPTCFLQAAPKTS